ncbi:MAG: hypothetical protein ACYTEW_25805, partial [Planctomycetota bacterium]
AIKTGASDVHINVGMPPVLRNNTELNTMDFQPVSSEKAKEMVLSMVGPDRFKRFEENRDLDFSTMLDDGHRFRVNAHYQKDTIAISFRVIPNQIPHIDDLHLHPIVKELADLPRGLVLVTGHTGSGKSTTLVQKTYNNAGGPCRIHAAKQNVHDRTTRNRLRLSGLRIRPEARVATGP